MYAFAQKTDSTRKTTSATNKLFGSTHAQRSHEAKSNLQSRRTHWHTLATTPLVQRKCTDCHNEESQQVSVQPRLRVGPADDVHEREADAIAHRVMAMNPMRLREVGRAQSIPRDTLRAHRESHTRGAGVGVGVSASALTSGGSPLPDATRRFFESRMERDFSNVRLHGGEQSSQLNGEIGASAFTFRDHIWLGGNVGRYPSFVLAHELAHVVQQTSPGEGGPISTSAAPPSIQRLSPPGNCEQDEHDNLQRLVKEICDPPKNWSGGTTRTWRQCKEDDSCGQLKLKIFRNQMCALRRRVINDKCYEGGDIGHRAAEQDARLGQSNCMALYRAKCEKTKPPPVPVPVPVPKVSPAAKRVGISALIGAGLGGIIGALIGGAGGAAGGTLVAPGVGTVGGGAAGGTAGAAEGAAIGSIAGAAVGTALQSFWEWVTD